MNLHLVALIVCCVVIVHQAESRGRRSGRRHGSRNRSGSSGLAWRLSELEALFENHSSWLEALQGQVDGLPNQQDNLNLNQSLQDQADTIQALQDRLNDIESCCVPVSQDVFTPDANSYQVIGDEVIAFPGNETSIKFKVQAGGDAHILLMQGNSTTTDIYEIVIGGWGNSQSAIRDVPQGPVLVTHSHVPLDVNTFRPFWVSWDGGVVRVGTGLTVGQDEFMSYTDPTPTDVNHVAVSTGFGATGQWVLYDNDCPCLS